MLRDDKRKAHHQKSYLWGPEKLCLAWRTHTSKLAWRSCFQATHSMNKKDGILFHQLRYQSSMREARVPQQTWPCAVVPSSWLIREEDCRQNDSFRQWEVKSAYASLRKMRDTSRAQSYVLVLLCNLWSDSFREGLKKCVGLAQEFHPFWRQIKWAIATGVSRHPVLLCLLFVHTGKLWL